MTPTTSLLFLLFGALQGSYASYVVMPIAEPLLEESLMEGQPEDFIEYDFTPVDYIKDKDLVQPTSLVGNVNKRFQEVVNNELIGLTRPRFGKRGLGGDNLIKMTMPRFGKRQVADIVDMVRPRFGKRKKRSVDSSDAQKLPKGFIQLGKGDCTLIYPGLQKRTLTMAYINSLIFDKIMKALPPLPYAVCMEDIKILGQLQMKSPKMFQAVLAKLAKHNTITEPEERVGKRTLKLEDLSRPRFGKRTYYNDLGDFDDDFMTSSYMRSLMSPFTPKLGLFGAPEWSEQESSLGSSGKSTGEKESGSNQ